MNVNLEDSYFAWTPFLMSAAKNQMEVMKFLKENGANMNYTHPVTRFNALHHAATGRQLCGGIVREKCWCRVPNRPRRTRRWTVRDAHAFVDRVYFQRVSPSLKKDVVKD